MQEQDEKQIDELADRLSAALETVCDAIRAFVKTCCSVWERFVAQVNEALVIWWQRTHPPTSNRFSYRAQGRKRTIRRSRCHWYRR